MPPRDLVAKVSPESNPLQHLLQRGTPLDQYKYVRARLTSQHTRPEGTNDPVTHGASSHVALGRVLAEREYSPKLSARASSDAGTLASSDTARATTTVTSSSLPPENS